jgi:hypothetical protein
MPFSWDGAARGSALWVHRGRLGLLWGEWADLHQMGAGAGATL